MSDSRTTRRMLQIKVDYLSRRLWRKFELRSQSSGNSVGYILVERRYQGSSGDHYVNNSVLSAREMRFYLDGMIDCIEGYATAGV